MTKVVKSPEYLLKFFSHPEALFPKGCTVESLKELSKERINILRSADENFVRQYLSGFYSIVREKLRNTRTGDYMYPPEHVLPEPKNLSREEMLELIGGIETHYFTMLKSKRISSMLYALNTLASAQANLYANAAEEARARKATAQGLGDSRALPTFNRLILELIGHNLRGSTIHGEGEHLFPLARSKRLFREERPR